MRAFVISSMADAFAELSSKLDADVVDIESDVSTERDRHLRLVLCTLSLPTRHVFDLIC